MARRPQPILSAPAITPRLRKHMAALGFHRLEDYLAWRRAEGFERDLDKDRQTLDAETARFEALARRSACQSQLQGNPRRLIKAACLGEIDASEVRRASLRALCEAIARSSKNAGSRATLCDFLLWAQAETKFLDASFTFGGVAYPAFVALIKLNDRRGQWRRDLRDWRQRSHNTQKQLSSLIRHLVADYPVPEFMDAAWLRTGRGSRLYREWFLHIARGKNIRTARTPIPLTKLMAHHFLEAPSSISIEGAIRWGEVHALGGDQTLTEAILGSRIGESFAENGFWSSVIRFFIANPMLDRRHVGPIVDYLHAQKFQEREIVDARGRTTREPPPQPNLEMRGRTAESLLAQVERWHRGLSRARGAEHVFFKSSGIPEFRHRIGEEEEGRVWRIRELHSGAELIAEGGAMRHCVASYAQSCAAGQRSIWAMELHGRSGVEKRQTIEVTNRREIVQCRGKLNRLPTQGEFEIVRRWSEKAGLTISPYVRTDA
jgi:hypothetical protein